MPATRSLLTALAVTFAGLATPLAAGAAQAAVDASDPQRLVQTLTTPKGSSGRCYQAMSPSIRSAIG
jgi:hypothetical protein